MAGGTRKICVLLGILVAACCPARPVMSYVVVSTGWLGGSSTIWMNRSGCLLSQGQEFGANLPASYVRISAAQANKVVGLIERSHRESKRPVDLPAVVAPDVALTSVYVRFGDGSIVRDSRQDEGGQRVVDLLDRYSGQRIAHPAAGTSSPIAGCPAVDDILGMIKAVEKR